MKLCTAFAAAAALLGLAVGGEAAAGPTLGAHGIGGVRFGLAKAKAVAELRGLVGAPTSRGVNTGCGPRYSEVEWRDLVAEFRLGRFTGYRYLVGGWPLTTTGSPHTLVLNGVTPKLVTRAGVTLGTPLADARRAYRGLRAAGVDRWRTADGLLLRTSESSPPRIDEIQVGTCGDF